MATELQVTFGERVRERRNELNWTQKQLARKLDMSQGYLSEIETGLRAPTLDTVERIAKALKSTADSLLAKS